MHFKFFSSFIFFLFFIFQNVLAQNQSAWELFERVKFVDVYVELYGMSMPWPEFTSQDLDWQGKEVIIAGYIIPTAEAAGFDGLIVSKFPYAQCFFCGEAGIESIALFQPKGEMPDFDLNKAYVFRGKIKFKDEDFEKLNFIINDGILKDL